MIRNSSILLFLALFFSGCNKPTITKEQLVEMNTVFYKCNSIEIEMRYFPLHGVAVLVLDGKTHELQQQVSASGVWYSNAKYSFRAKGDDGWLEIGRMALMECKAISGLI